MQQIVLTNSKGNNLKSLLSEVSREADEIKIAVAFFVDTEFINHCCKVNKAIRIIVSLRPPTNYYSLKKILSQKIQVKYLGSDFHSKYFILSKKGIPYACIIGSSNLTTGGVEKNIETNVLIYDQESINALDEQFTNLWSKASTLHSDELSKYKDIFDRFSKRQIQARKEMDLFEKAILNKLKKRNSKLYREVSKYYDFTSKVDEVKTLVQVISAKEFPGIPVYLVIDHFWHWIKIFWDKKGQTINESERSLIIPSLFLKFCKWDKEGHQHTEQMNKASKTIFGKYLKESYITKLTKNEAMEIYRNLHSGAHIAQRFHVDEKFISENKLSKIRKTFHYLLYSNDDIVERIFKVCHDPEFKLRHFNSSTTQELIGWRFPEKYALRNNKADYAIRRIGFKF